MVRALYRPPKANPQLHPVSQMTLDEISARAAPSWHSSDYDALGEEIYGKTTMAVDNWGRSMAPQMSFSAIGAKLR